MHPVIEEVRAIVSSPVFVRSRQLCRFLEHVVQRTIDGDTVTLKESILGIEVFGRRAGYDSRADPIVRTEARRLRQKLALYYSTRPPRNGVKISLPAGGYVPEWEMIAVVTNRKEGHVRLRLLAGLAAIVLVLILIGVR